MRKRVLLIGKMGSGKDYLADWLKINHDFNIVKLAAPVKEYFEIAAGRKPNKSSEDDRRELQEIGCGMRKVNKDFWCEIAEKKLHPRDARFVIADCRFINEVSYFSDFLKVRLIVSPMIRRGRLIERDGAVFDNLMDDSSETELEDIVPDVTIDMSSDGVPQEFIDLFSS